MKTKICNSWLKYLVRAHFQIRFFFVALNMLALSNAFSQNQCQENLKKAQNLYERGYFQTAVSLVDSCLRANAFDKEQEIEALSVMARAYLADDYPDKAEAAVKRLLQLQPDYQPPTPQDPKFIELVRKNVIPPRSWWAKRKWWVIGGTVAYTASALMVYQLFKAEPDKPLPQPPALPLH